MTKSIYDTHWSWDYSKSQQTEYETETEWKARVQEYITDAGLVTYKIRLDSSYDLTSETLTVYYEKRYRDNNIEGGRGMYHSYSIEDDYNGEEEFIWHYLYITDLDSYSLIEDEDNIIFHQFNISPKEAESLDNSFYIIVDTNLKYVDGYGILSRGYKSSISLSSQDSRTIYVDSAKITLLGNQTEYRVFE